MNRAILPPSMGTSTGATAPSTALDKPSLLALVNQSEMRQSLNRIAGMTDHQREVYASRFMDKYREPLTEAGIFTETKDARIAEIVLCALNHAIFDRSY